MFSLIRGNSPLGNELYHAVVILVRGRHSKHFCQSQLLHNVRIRLNVWMCSVYWCWLLWFVYCYGAVLQRRRVYDVMCVGLLFRRPLPKCVHKIWRRLVCPWPDLKCFSLSKSVEQIRNSDFSAPFDGIITRKVWEFIASTTTWNLNSSIDEVLRCTSLCWCSWTLELTNFARCIVQTLLVVYLVADEFGIKLFSLKDCIVYETDIEMPLYIKFYWH